MKDTTSVSRESLNKSIMKSCVAVLLLMALCSAGLRAQEKEGTETFSHSRHSLGVMIGHMHSFEGIGENGKKQTLVLPFWGIDYNYQLTEKFALGLHTDIIVESFKVQRNIGGNEDELLERNKPVAPAVVGSYKVGEHWKFGLGMGGEFAKESNYTLNRVAIEYGSELGGGKWEVFGALQYDIRWKAYDTYTIGLGIIRLLGSHKKD